MSIGNQEIDYVSAMKSGFTDLRMFDLFAEFSNVYKKPSGPWTDPSGIVWVFHADLARWFPQKAHSRLESE